MLIQLRTDPILLEGLFDLDLEGKNTRNIKHMATGRVSELEPPRAGAFGWRLEPSLWPGSGSSFSLAS